MPLSIPMIHAWDIFRPTIKVYGNNFCMNKIKLYNVIIQRATLNIRKIKLISFCVCGFNIKCITIFFFLLPSTQSISSDEYIINMNMETTKKKTRVIIKGPKSGKIIYNLNILNALHQQHLLTI